MAHLAEALARIGFLSRQNPDHILRDVRSLLGRAGLTARDVQIWRGIARQVLWAAGAGAVRDDRPSRRVKAQSDPARRSSRRLSADPGAAGSTSGRA